MRPERLELVNNLRQQIEYERSILVRQTGFSAHLKANILAFLKTVGSMKQGCKMLGFTYNTAQKWHSDAAKKNQSP